MLGRWIIVCLWCVASLHAIQRPDTKTTLRGLTRLPRMDYRFSLDFSSAAGFSIFDVSQSGAARRDGRSVDALKRRLDSEPGNARLKAEFAQTLHATGRAVEAESIFREAVKNAPNSVTNWIAFASFLESRAWEIAADISGPRPYAELCRRVARRQPSGELMDKAARLLDESCDAAREAVSIDEDNAATHWRLGINLASRACLDLLRARIAGTLPPGDAIDTLIFNRQALPAFEKAADLDGDPIYLASLILWRGMCEVAEKKLAAPGWENLSDATRARIEAGMQRLAAIEGSATAAQTLGTLRFLLQRDYRAAADDLRNAIALNPDVEQVWETLGLVLLRSENFYELAAISQARVLVRPVVRNRALLANAYERLGMRSRAIEEAQGALALNGNDFSANLLLANLLMRDSDDDVPPRVRQTLSNAERAIRGAGTGTQLVELALAQSIYHGLVDETDRAREILKAALAVAKDDPDVAAALSAIGY